jgi:hypothetical protein
LTSASKDDIGEVGDAGEGIEVMSSRFRRYM